MRSVGGFSIKCLYVSLHVWSFCTKSLTNRNNGYVYSTSWRFFDGNSTSDNPPRTQNGGQWPCNYTILGCESSIFYPIWYLNHMFIVRFPLRAWVSDTLLPVLQLPCTLGYYRILYFDREQYDKTAGTSYNFLNFLEFKSFEK